MPIFHWSCEWQKREALFLPFTPTYTTSFIVSFGWKKQTTFSCLYDQNPGKLQESNKLKAIYSAQYFVFLRNTHNKYMSRFYRRPNKFAGCLLILTSYKLDNLEIPCELDRFFTSSPIQTAAHLSHMRYIKCLLVQNSSCFEEQVGHYFVPIGLRIIHGFMDNFWPISRSKIALHNVVWPFIYHN